MKTAFCRQYSKYQFSSYIHVFRSRSEWQVYTFDRLSLALTSIKLTNAGIYGRASKSLAKQWVRFAYSRFRCFRLMKVVHGLWRCVNCGLFLLLLSEAIYVLAYRLQTSRTISSYHNFQKLTNIHSCMLVEWSEMAVGHSNCMIHDPCDSSILVTHGPLTHCHLCEWYSAKTWCTVACRAAYSLVLCCSAELFVLGRVTVFRQVIMRDVSKARHDSFSLRCMPLLAF